METLERNKLLRQILWDYNIDPEDVDAVLKGERERAGHYSKEMLFQKLIESYSWFTVIQLISPVEIQTLLTKNLINKLRTPSLRSKYEFVRKRLQEVIPAAG
ncbi:MAG: hypothetical protein WCO63_05220 [Bacteroidota bacterium]